MILGINAARIYGFDLGGLRHLADQIGPTPSELGQVDDAANQAGWSEARSRGRFWLQEYAAQREGRTV
jgi:hypothetical protein